MNRNFSQAIVVFCDDAEVLIGMLADWDRQQAKADIMGYMGTRLLQDRGNPRRYVISADFGVIDPAVSALEEAERNNTRPETQAWAAHLLEVIDGQPEYHNYDELYRTG